MDLVERIEHLQHLIYLVIDDARQAIEELCDGILKQLIVLDLTQLRLIIIGTGTLELSLSRRILNAEPAPADANTKALLLNEKDSRKGPFNLCARGGS